MRVRFECSDPKTGRWSFPVYDVNSPFELFDRMMKLRYRKGLTHVERRDPNAGRYDKNVWWCLGTQYSKTGFTGHINGDRLDDPEYVEELAVRLWERGMKVKI